MRDQDNKTDAAGTAETWTVTRTFLPDSKAVEHEYVDGLSVTQAEYELIRLLSPEGVRS